MDVRVVIVQPILAHYRIPVFERLGGTPGIDLTVAADLRSQTEDLDGAWRPEAFELRHSPCIKVGPLVRQDGMEDVARDSAYDVVMFTWDSRRYQLPKAVRAARRHGKGVVLWGHGIGTTLPRLGSLVRNRLIQAADACVLYGEPARASLISKGYDADKLFVAPNALDQEPIERAATYWSTGERLRDFRREHGIEGRNLLLYVSRLERDKRPDMLLGALRRIRAGRNDVELIFIGGGSFEPELRASVVRSELTAVVRFLGPIYDEMRIAPWMLSSICMVHPERLGLSVLHAFGYGTPVITSSNLTSHMPEIEVFLAGANGLSYRTGDVEDLALKVLALADDDSLRLSLSEGALAAVTGPHGRNLSAMVAGLLRAIYFAANRSEERRR
jgi:glycosyltransferase involved in cell wall biosynthesis